MSENYLEWSLLERNAAQMLQCPQGKAAQHRNQVSSAYLCGSEGSVLGKALEKAIEFNYDEDTKQRDGTNHSVRARNVNVRAVTKEGICSNRTAPKAVWRAYLRVDDYWISLTQELRKSGKRLC